MKYKFKYSTNFKKSLKKLNKIDIEKTFKIIYKLANNEILETKYKDHALKGDLKDFRECHIKPDLLLIYQKQDDELILYCFSLGSHSELF